MRFMLLMIPKGYEKADEHAVPSAEAVDAMMKYNESLRKAGVLLTLDGLHPQRAGARVEFSGGKHIVTDGPFIETREALGGYWIIDVKSKADAVAWAARCPGDNCTIEVRQVFEMSEFPEDVRKVAARYPEVGRHVEQRKEKK
ncbi:MAG: YciI family protein [bacterium]